MNGWMDNFMVQQILNMSCHLRNIISTSNSQFWRRQSLIPSLPDHHPNWITQFICNSVNPGRMEMGSKQSKWVFHNSQMIFVWQMRLCDRTWFTIMSTWIGVFHMHWTKNIGTSFSIQQSSMPLLVVLCPPFFVVGGPHFHHTRGNEFGNLISFLHDKRLIENTLPVVTWGTPCTYMSYIYYYLRQDLYWSKHILGGTFGSTKCDFITQL
jgi:hypothetical protein